MARDVARDQCRADLLGLERVDLLVHRADADALCVIEYRTVDRAGYVVERELRFAARIDDGVELFKLRQDVAEIQ